MEAKKGNIIEAPSTNLGSVFESSTRNGLFYIVFAVAVYFVVFIPVSFVEGRYIKQVWSTGLFLLWLVMILCNVAYFGRRIRAKRIDVPLLLLAFGLSLLFWGVSLLLGIFQLTPITLYIEPVYLVTSYGFFLLNMLYESSIKYENYLSQSITFAFEGARFFGVVGTLSLVLRLGRTLSLVPNLSPDNILTFIFEVAQLILLLILIYEALTLRLADPDSSGWKVIKVFAAGFVALTANFIVYKTLNFWWLGVLAFLTSVFYVAYIPSKRKSNILIYLLFCVFGFSMVLDTLGFRPTLDELSTVFQSWMVVGIVVPLVPSLPAFIKTTQKLWSSRKQTDSQNDSASRAKIESAAVILSSEEIVKADGLSLGSIDNILAIAIIANNFDFVENLVEQKPNVTAKDLHAYFHVYLLAARFTVEDGIIVESRAPDGTITEELITESSVFGRYLVEYLPKEIRDYDVWTAFLQNRYIRSYISKAALETRVKRPPSLWARMSKWVYYALVAIIIFTLVMQMNGFVILRYVPEVLTSISTWSSSRVTDLRLAFVEAFEPYRTDDQSQRAYYSDSFYDWYIDWKDYHNPFSQDEAVRGIDLTRLLLTLYPENGTRFRVANHHLGLYYIFTGDCDAALPYLNQALIDEENPGTREEILARIGDCEAADVKPPQSF